MHESRLSLCLNGAYMHWMGDVTPIEVRYSEPIRSEDLPLRRLLTVSAGLVLDWAPMVDPRAVLIENLAGRGIPTYPTEEEAAKLASQVLLAGVTRSAEPADLGIELMPARPGHCPGQGQWLWLAPGARVVVAPREPGIVIPIRVVVFPGSKSPGIVIPIPVVVFPGSKSL